MSTSAASNPGATSPAGERAATLAGLAAVGLWSGLAVLTAATGAVPPFALASLTFLVGGAMILAVALARGRLARARPTPGSLALGVAGLLGDSALYYAALKLAPPALGNLAHYLWPLLIVLLAAGLPGGRLRPRHLLGAGLGFLATALLVLARDAGDGAAGAGAALGIGLALVGAVVWAGYSVLSRRFAQVPSESLGVTCLAVSGLAALIHLALRAAGLEGAPLPASGAEWLAVLLLGLGPMGAAFLLWDVGMKRGDVALLGVASYAAPVLSTLGLVLAGFAAPSWWLAGACGLITAGALVAARPGRD